jgi:hypothetical protein
LLEVLLTTITTERVRGLEDKRSSIKGVNWRFETLLCPPAIPVLRRFLHSHATDITLQGIAIGLGQIVTICVIKTRSWYDPEHDALTRYHRYTLLLEVLLTIIPCIRVLGLVIKRTSNKIVQWKFKSPVCPLAIPILWRFLHSHSADITLQGLNLGLWQTVTSSTHQGQDPGHDTSWGIFVLHFC